MLGGYRGTKIQKSSWMVLSVITDRFLKSEFTRRSIIQWEKEFYRSC